MATNPSPVVLTSLPSNRKSWVRTMASWLSSTVRQPASLRRAARSEDETMSVKSTVANRLSCALGVPVRR